MIILVIILAAILSLGMVYVFDSVVEVVVQRREEYCRKFIIGLVLSTVGVFGLMWVVNI